MRLEHVGIAIADLDEAIKSFEALLARAPYKQEVVPTEGVATHFFSAGEVKIELLESLDAHSPIARFLEKHGPGLHHLAFLVDDLVVTRRRLTEAGFDVIGESDSNGADGKRIFFVHPKSTGGVLVECCAHHPDNGFHASEKLPSGAVMHRFGNVNNANPRILIVGPKTAFDFGQDLARRFELNYDVLLFEMNDATASNESIYEDYTMLSEKAVPFTISIGSSYAEIQSIRNSGLYELGYWIHISRTMDGIDHAANRNSPDATILVADLSRESDSRTASAAAAILPPGAVRPGSPDHDSLVPLIRSLWVKGKS